MTPNKTTFNLDQVNRDYKPGDKVFYKSKYDGQKRCGSIPSRYAIRHWLKEMGPESSAAILNHIPIVVAYWGGDEHLGWMPEIEVFPDFTFSGMEAKTLRALRGSIAKWKGILADGRQDNGVQDCPLCGLFHNNNCHGCPVRHSTGEPNCGNTPYAEWAKVQAKDKTMDHATTPATLHAAYKELTFLRGLLPEGVSENEPVVVPPDERVPQLLALVEQCRAEAAAIAQQEPPSDWRDWPATTGQV